MTLWTPAGSFLQQQSNNKTMKDGVLSSSYVEARAHESAGRYGVNRQRTRADEKARANKCWLMRAPADGRRKTSRRATAHARTRTRQGHAAIEAHRSDAKTSQLIVESLCKKIK